MAKFKVGTEALRESAHRLRVCAGQVAIAAEHHRDTSRWECAEGSILEMIQPGHEALADMLQRRLEKDSRILITAALALTEAARRYDASDVDARALI